MMKRVEDVQGEGLGKEGRGPRESPGLEGGGSCRVKKGASDYSGEVRSGRGERYLEGGGKEHRGATTKRDELLIGKTRGRFFVYRVEKEKAHVRGWRSGRHF